MSEITPLSPTDRVDGRRDGHPAASGALSREEFLAREARVGAFVFTYPDAAAHAPTNGPLAGLRVGVKDVIETADAPTALGSDHYRDRQTGRDAAVVSALRTAGAVLIGKTTTAEFAYRDAPETRNPLDPTRTPGGSSSGSAAAVAAGLVDAALGTQTGGSIIRPAAFCGVVGYKPTHGLVTTSGVMQLAPSFDTVGVLAGNVATVVRVTEVIAGFPASEGSVAPRRIGVLPAADLARCDPETSAALEVAAACVAEAGGARVVVDLPTTLDRLRELHGLINAYEGARSLRAEAGHGRPQTEGLIERGLAISTVEYVAAVAELELVRPDIDAALGEFDALLCPATLGRPPVGLEFTGDSYYCQPWSAARVPAITLPVHPVGGGLPVGIQLVAPRWNDVRLLGVASWFEVVLGSDSYRPEV